MKTIFFSHSRTALKYGIKALQIQEGDNILIPDYICDVILHPLKQLKLLPQYYPLLDDLSPDWKILGEMLTIRTKAVLMVHYFGQPQRIHEFQEFCKKHSLYLIEDNAHGFCGKHEGKLLGTFGDIGITSPRKTLDLPSGGILHINYSKSQLIDNNIEILDTFQINYLKETIKRKLKYFTLLKRFTRKHIKARPIYWDPSAFKEMSVPDLKIDSFSKYFITNVNDSNIRRDRQRVYLDWFRFALNKGLKPVFSKLGKEACPIVFPAYTNGPVESRFWFDWGWKRGYNISSWPTLPDEIINKDGDELDRWKRLICFPIE